MILQQQKQKSTMLNNDIMEKETILANVKADLDGYNEQLRRNAQELLQVINSWSEAVEKLTRNDSRLWVRWASM